MSEMQEFQNNQEDRFDPMAVIPAQGEKTDKTYNLKDLEKSIDGQSYFIGEVPQVHLLDPQAFLPLNSDRLIGSVNMIEKLLGDVSLLIQEEVNLIQKHQRKINFWEERIEKNKAIVEKNLVEIKKNNADAIYDKKNRDYWLGRAEEVEIDYTHAEVASRQQDWMWLIKKYGLKNADGSGIDAKNPCVEELCNGESNNLASEYRSTGNRYESERKAKEAENSRMVRENAKLKNSNEVLQTYIASTYANEVEPLQDGVLLLKELGVKLKAMGQDGNGSTFGEMRSWAEVFLSDFIKSNPRVALSVVTDFRKLTSIPLPADHS
ncbi:MAG TPA: hypothetical protein VLE89_05095 [Chlamydiales bacterium]|nr:hypothetical protein [Chlamydiales bacterium]